MPRSSKPRSGSLQFWPRKRANSVIPSVNWEVVEKASKDNKKVLGFVGYKVGMARVLARDLTQHSMTKGKQIIIPVSLIECPPMKIFSVRFYKNSRVATEILSENLDKELKRRLRLPKNPGKKLGDIEKNIANYDDIRVVAYTLVKKTSIKKVPDIVEVAIGGNITEKLETVKKFIGKDINITDVFGKNQLVDLRGTTKGKGIQGPVKRFGIALRQHKSEKGVRKAGSLGPWKPSRLTFRAPLMGQMGFFTRIVYNTRIIDIGTNPSSINYKEGFMHYGMINNNYIIVKGSVQGPQKRPIFITAPFRPSKITARDNFEIVSILK